MRHQAHVLPVVGADLLQAIGELLPLAPKLLEAAEATSHGVPPGVDHLCIGQDQLDQTNMEKVVRHFVDEVWCAGSIHTGLIDKLLTETLEHRGV